MLKRGKSIPVPPSNRAIAFEVTGERDRIRGIEKRGGGFSKSYFHLSKIGPETVKKPLRCGW